MNIVLISPAGSVLSNLTETGLTPGGPDSAVVLVWDDAPRTVQDADVISVGRPPGPLHKRLVPLLVRSALGRNLLRVSPLDGGRRMWRATRRNPAAVEALRTADLIVAVEREAILTGWRSARSLASADCDAVYGMPAGRAIITRQVPSAP